MTGVPTRSESPRRRPQKAGTRGSVATRVRNQSRPTATRKPDKPARARHLVAPRHATSGRDPPRPPEVRRPPRRRRGGASSARGGAPAGRARWRPPARQGLAPAPSFGAAEAGESLGLGRAVGRRLLAPAGEGPPPRVREAWRGRGDREWRERPRDCPGGSPACRLRGCSANPAAARSSSPPSLIPARALIVPHPTTSGLPGREETRVSTANCPDTERLARVEKATGPGFPRLPRGASAQTLTVPQAEIVGIRARPLTQ